MASAKSDKDCDLGTGKFALVKRSAITLICDTEFSHFNNKLYNLQYFSSISEMKVFELQAFSGTLCLGVEINSHEVLSSEDDLKKSNNARLDLNLAITTKSGRKMYIEGGS